MVFRRNLQTPAATSSTSVKTPPAPPTLKPPPPPAMKAPVAPVPSAPKPAAAPMAPTPTLSRMAKERDLAFQEMKGRIHRKLVEQIDLAKLEGGDEEVNERLREAIQELVDTENAILNVTERMRLVGEIFDEVRGLGPLEVLLKDERFSEIMINGPAKVYVEHAGKLHQCDGTGGLPDVRFKDEAHLLQIIDKIVSAVGRRCDETTPMADARLKDGSRFNAIIRPLAIDGASVSIRRFGSKIFSWEDYLKVNACTKEMMDFMKGCVHAGLNVMISGGTGSGKTTLLNNCSSFIPSDDRIITVEDAAELRLQQPHVVRLETRPANIEGKGQVTIRDLVRNALRMRPDRLVVGECRGAEALDMLQAMNTGHDGSMTTVHANSPREVVARVETLVMMAGFDLPVKAIRQQFASAIQLIVQVSRLAGGPRKVVGVTEVTGLEGDVVTMQDIFQFEQTGVDENGRARGRFITTGIRPQFYERLSRAGAALPADLFERQILKDNC